MKKHYWFIFLLCVFNIAYSSGQPEKKEAEQPDLKVPFGDPFILLHNGTYYAYGTQAKDGIAVYISTDLLHWKTPENLPDGLALKKKDVWAEQKFWAPEVYRVNSNHKFYMYYSADEHVCVAVSDNPLGPFKQDVQKPMIEGEKTIDNSMFMDDNGKAYLFFDRFNDGLNVWVAELQDNLIDLKPETMHPCIHVSQAWEEVWPRVNEGSFVVKHNGVYYMTYSANSYESPFYGIGVATATDIMGKWTKYENNPIYQNVGDLVGIGHSAMFKDKDGRLRIVFHAHHSKTQIHPRNMYISTVSFETKNGKEIMKIDPDYITPVLVKETVLDGKYRNPVIRRSTPDPSIIQVSDGSFYLYSTEDIRNMPIYHSTDLVHWTFVGTAFTAETRPTFEPKGGLWAPDINYINGQYVLYYSMSVWGGEQTCGIGVATADKPEGPFTDRGMLFRSNGIGVQNSIDQNYVEDNGKKYLFWGSFHGIFGIELTADGLAIKPGSEKRQVAGTAYEGTYIHKRGKYYYLFASTGSCCEGLKSTYTTVVGRSENLWGPYVDKQRRPMMDNHHEVVIHGNAAFVGTGHDSEIVQDKAGNDWIFYHGYSVANTTGRSLLMDKIIWIDDWPTVAGDSPSIEAEAPVFFCRNPLPVALGDPFMLKASDGKFYLYGTSEGLNGFKTYSSSDWIHWKDEGQIYEGATPDSWTVDCFWAPEVYEVNGKYYMLFSSNWRENPANEQENFRIGVAVADKPAGPFKDLMNRPIFDPGYPIIDANLWFEDGRIYLYYSRCCYKHPVQSEIADWAKAQGWYDEIEESWVYGVEIKPDFSGIIGEPELLLRPPVSMNDKQAEWESRSVTSHEVNRRWTEGSFIFKNKDTYYIMYSANYFGGKNYAVGYATSKNPLGPFVKADNNPVLQKNTEKGGDVTGTGHCMALTIKGKMYCVYHGRTEKTGDKRMAFIDPMEILPDGKLVVLR